MPARDVELLSWAKRFAEELAPYVEQKRIAEDRYSELMAALQEYDAAVQEHERLAALVAATTMDKMNKKTPLMRILRSLAETVKYDNDKGFDPNFDGKDPNAKAKRTPQADQRRAPAISLATRPGRVIVRLDEVPAWASGICVYRRKRGETQFEMLAFTKSRKYVDEIDGEPSKYEYAARFWLKKENVVSPESRVVRIESRERKAT